MKKYVTYLLMLIALFCISTSAAAQIEKHFDPEQDTLISCDANPADYTGMTFDGDVYVLLNGCADLKSTVIPGDNSFLTLRDIKVNGTLYFVDDTFDAAGGTYRESLTYDSLTRAHHYLNLAGNSYVENLYMECMNPHDCNLGLQYPSEINNLHIVPTNAATRGRISVRGYIDPLVDEATDYYTDTTVASFPEFNFETFDNDFSYPLMEKYKVFFMEAYSVANSSIYFGTDQINNNYYPYTENLYEKFVNKYPYDKEVAATNIYLKRARVQNLNIFNKYLCGSGETNIDLINLFVEKSMITNGKSIDSTTSTDFARKWIPVLRAGGFTNIGILSVYSELKTDIVKDEETSPTLYIDAMVVGTEGLTENITLKSVKIAMLNYFGGMSPYSNLKLVFIEPDTNIARHIPSIGIVMAHGGKIDLKAKAYYSAAYHVGDLYLFSGREDLTFETDVNGISSAEGFLTLPVTEDYLPRLSYYTEDDTDPDTKPFEEIITKYAERYYPDFKEIYEWGDVYKYTDTIGTTSIGTNWITNLLYEYAKPAPENIEQNKTTSVNFNGVSFGDMKIDDSLQDTDWFSASCAVHQYGALSSTSSKIDYITR